MRDQYFCDIGFMHLSHSVTTYLYQLHLHVVPHTRSDRTEIICGLVTVTPVHPGLSGHTLSPECVILWNVELNWTSQQLELVTGPSQMDKSLLVSELPSTATSRRDTSLCCGPDKVDSSRVNHGGLQSAGSNLCSGSVKCCIIFCLSMDFGCPLWVSWKVSMNTKWSKPGRQWCITFPGAKTMS